MEKIGEHPLGSEQMFANQILTRWEKVLDLSEKYRVGKIMKADDPDIIYPYASMLCSMWGELQPEVGQLKNDDAFIQDYNSFEGYYLDTQSLIDDTQQNEQAVYRFQMTIKTAIKKLGLTTKMEAKK